MAKPPRERWDIGMEHATLSGGLRSALSLGAEIDKAAQGVGVFVSMVVVFFGDYWDDMWRRRQQLAWRLAQVDKIGHVVYIERPLPVTSFLKFLVSQADRDGTDRWRRVLHNRSWVMSAGENLSVLTTFAPLPPVDSVSLFQASERFRDHWLLSRLRKHFDVTRPIIWVSHPQLSTDVLQALEPRLLWYDCTEDFAARPEYAPCVREQIRQTDTYLAENADVVSVVSHVQYEMKRQNRPDAHWIPNAVDTDLFLACKTAAEPADLAGIAHPRLGFVGGINDRHDWGLIGSIVRIRPKWSIILIGAASLPLETIQTLSKYPAIHFLGQKPYSVLPAYLRHVDVCIQVYKPQSSPSFESTQKTFLYLASGKPIVSYEPTSADTFRDGVRVARTGEEFVMDVEDVLANDTEELCVQRLALAKTNAWTERLVQITGILQTKLRK